MKYGPATCHPDLPAKTSRGLCSRCYDRAAYHERQIKRAARVLTMPAPDVEAPPKRGRPSKDETTDAALKSRMVLRSMEPPALSLDDAIAQTDAELVAALPEAAMALRRQLHTRQSFKAAELILKSFVVPSPEGPRRFLSAPATNDRPAVGTQVAIGLYVNPSGDGTVQVGKVVGSLDAPARHPHK